MRKIILGLAAWPLVAGHVMYMGTLDKRLLVIDEDQEEVVSEIPLSGVPRTTALSADQKHLYVLTTRMVFEVVDLESKKVVSTFTLSDERSRPRMVGMAPDRINPGRQGRYSGMAVDPKGRYVYTTMRVAVKDIDHYRVEPAQFVAIDVQDKKIAKTWSFPPDMDQGFGFMATYKVSPDGKLLYVFQDDVLIWDLDSFKQVGRIELSKPPYPGASPYRLTVTEDPYDDTSTVTSVFTSVDPVVHKGTLGLAKINLETKKVDYKPIGPSLPMMGFLVSPDRKKGFSVAVNGAGGNRRVEWWVWDISTGKVVKKQEFEGRPTFRFGVSSDGKKLYMYGAGSTLEIFDAETLQSRKLLYLNRDTTTNLITTSRGMVGAKAD